MARNSNSEGIGCAVALVAIVGLGYACYAGMDSVGWYPHREDSVITARENWFVGESKDCISYPLDAKTARSSGRLKGYATAEIDCDGGPEHNVPITFWGRTEQPQYQWVTWRCTRNSDSFTCKQVGNSTPTLTGTDRATGRPVVSYDGGKTWQWANQ
jgi:hypothetical protein